MRKCQRSDGPNHHILRFISRRPFLELQSYTTGCRQREMGRCCCSVFAFDFFCFVSFLFAFLFIIWVLFLAGTMGLRTEVLRILVHRNQKLVAVRLLGADSGNIDKNNYTHLVLTSWSPFKLFCVTSSEPVTTKYKLQSYK